MLIKVLTWNCRALRNKIPELSQFLIRNFYHVVLIQETWLDEKVKIKIPNYVCLRKDRNAQGGGVCIFLHDSIHFNSFDFCHLESIESLFIKIFIDNRSFIIGSIYSSSSLTTTQLRTDYNKLFCRADALICAGDFNAKHTRWNNSTSNKKGLKSS